MLHHNGGAHIFRASGKHFVKDPNTIVQFHICNWKANWKNEMTTINCDVGYNDDDLRITFYVRGSVSLLRFTPSSAAYANIVQHQARSSSSVTLSLARMCKHFRAIVSRFKFNKRQHIKRLVNKI